MKALKVLFGLILVLMIIVTSWATSQESIFIGGPKVMAEPWAVATLADAYFGFFTFYAWVFYKESSFMARTGWFVAIMLLGNMAMAAYMLWQLFTLPAGKGAEALLLKRS